VMQIELVIPPKEIHASDANEEIGTSNS